jgi:N-acetylmuramoyl-L-alanine amidase
VVLPIFWEERTDEMNAVLEAAKKVEGLLASLGVRVVVDDNNKFKPGPRMKHW